MSRPFGGLERLRVEKWIMLELRGADWMIGHWTNILITEAAIKVLIQRSRAYSIQTFWHKLARAVFLPVLRVVYMSIKGSWYIRVVRFTALSKNCKTDILQPCQHNMSKIVVFVVKLITVNQLKIVKKLVNSVKATVQYSTVQYSTVQYSTVQYSTVQYSTVQYSTVQYSYSTVTVFSTNFYVNYQLYWLDQLLLLSTPFH